MRNAKEFLIELARQATAGSLGKDLCRMLAKRVNASAELSEDQQHEVQEDINDVIVAYSHTNPIQSRKEIRSIATHINSCHA